MRIDGIVSRLKLSCQAVLYLLSCVAVVCNLCAFDQVQPPACSRTQCVYRSPQKAVGASKGVNGSKRQAKSPDSQRADAKQRIALNGKAGDKPKDSDSESRREWVYEDKVSYCTIQSQCSVEQRLTAGHASSLLGVYAALDYPITLA